MRLWERKVFLGRGLDVEGVGRTLEIGKEFLFTIEGNTFTMKIEASEELSDELRM